MRIGGGAVSIADVTDRTARDLGFVRDFWLNEIRAGRAFMSGTAIGASGGNYSHLQLFNPVGSGITIIVYAIFVSTLSAGRVHKRTHNTALSSLSQTGTNLLAGQSAAIGEIRSESPAALQGTRVMDFSTLAQTLQEITRGWTFELGAGEGVLVVPNAVNVQIEANYYWIEL